MNNLYELYLQERENCYVIRHDGGKAFITYKFLADPYCPDRSILCYIQDIYVLPSHRQSKIASSMADEVTKLAKKEGCTQLMGTVQPSMNGATTSLKVLLGYGFRLHRSEIDYIEMRKDV